MTQELGGEYFYLKWHEDLYRVLQPIILYIFFQQKVNFFNSKTYCSTF